VTADPDAFYLTDGERFLPTPLTRGPWSADAQHAGPPAALLGRALERLEPTGRMRVARFTMEILRSIPLVPVRVDARVVRPGGRVQHATASLVAVTEDGDREVARAAAWLLRIGADPVAEAGLELSEPDGPADAAETPIYRLPWTPNYFDAMEWRFVRGGVAESGPAAAWVRMRGALVGGEAPSPLTRLLVAADSGNGISAVLPFDRSLFINLDLSIHLARLPDGPWLRLDATTRIDPGGIGFTETVLSDERGRVGVGAQCLLVEPRTRLG
jgi:hypothetical protein